MDPQEWVKKKEKLINWMDTGQCVHWALHRFEYALIIKALNYWEQTHNLNPVAQEVYDHIMMIAGESEVDKEYPSEKALNKIRTF